MSSLLIVLGSLVIFSVALAAGARFLSRRRLFPCPASLRWILESRIMEGVAGGSALIKRAGVQPGMRVLDAGCGPGRLTIPLARWVGERGEVVALDVQPAMLSALKDRLKREGLSNIRTVHAALGAGALAGEQFERAFLVTVLGEIPDQESALREIYGALKPGGILSVTEILPDPHYQRQSVVRKLAVQTGFIPTVVYHNYRAFTMNLVRPEFVESEKGTKSGSSGQ